MDAIFSVIIGVSSSLIATLIFFTFSWALKTHILPWYEDKIYQGVRVDGKWEINLQESSLTEGSATLILEQKSDNIQGTLQLKAKENYEYSIYIIDGKVRNNYLVVSLWPESKKQIDAGSLAARIYTSKGLKMEGILTFSYEKGSSLQSREVEIQHTSD